MRLDYSEKRGARESIEPRKPVQKNRPRKEPMGMFALLSVVALLVTFGAGVLTGWLLFKGPRAQTAAAVVTPPAKEPAASVSGQAPLKAGPDAPLTFYKTLPAGGKGMIGSGLNLEKTQPVVSAPKPAAVAAPAAAAQSEEKKEAAARFVVQIASYRAREEADQVRAKLAEKGVAAYVQESKVPDKGVWYRIRVGRHLTKAEAEELAGKAGKGAVVLQE